MNLTDTVTVLNPTSTTDGYNNTVESWATPTETASPAWVGGQATREVLAAGDRTTQLLACILPASAPVTAKSRIRWRGDDYTIDGAPLPQSRRSVLHHYELTLKLVEG